MPPRLIFIDQIALAGCARTPFNGFVMTGSSLNLSSDKFELYCYFVIDVLPFLACTHLVARTRRRLQNSGYQPGSACVIAVFRTLCGRSSRISAGQMKSVADKSMDNSKNSDGWEEEKRLRLV